jgi:hypothetical protein
MALQRRVSFNENPRVFKQTSLISAIFRSLSGHFRRSAVVVATQFCWRIDSWKHWIPAAFALVHGIQLIISLGRNLADPLPQERRAPSTIISKTARSYYRKTKAFTKDLQERYGDILCLLTLLFELYTRRTSHSQSDKSRSVLVP